MLIQAQCQSEREKRCKITANDKEIKNADESAAADDDAATQSNSTPQQPEQPVMNGDANHTDVEMLDLDGASAKTELHEDASNATDATNDSTKMECNDSNQNGIETSPKEIKIEDTDDDDPYSKDIAIEPRTYCKLGHFHLLLEDYPKGEWLARIEVGLCPNFLQFFNIFSLSLQPYQRTRNFIA